MKVLAAVVCAALAAAGPPARAHWAAPAAPPAAQELIDRGVVMLYAFDMGEARVAFESASRAAPALTLPYAGLALAETLDINTPSTPQGERRGAAAVAQARAHLAGASEDERVLVAALGRRFGPGTQTRKFRGFADTLSAYVRAHRDDANLLTVAAFAAYLADDRDAFAASVLPALDRALQLDPDNLGARHLRIHALEVLGRSREAIPDAQALDGYAFAPGESHLPHMAGHIWARVGDYDKLVSSSERALANDRAWFALGDGPGQRSMQRYHDHDVDFLLYGLTTSGRDDEARAAVRDEDGEMKARLAIRLHEGAAALAAAPAGVPLLRGLAAARAQDAQAARSAQARLGGESGRIERGLIGAVLALAQGRAAAAAAAYAPLYERTRHDEPGDPKDRWIAPIGEGYGAALLAAGRYARAQAVFAAELLRFPNDPRLAWGLAEAQKAQGNDDAAARAAYRAHWKGSRELSLAELG